MPAEDLDREKGRRVQAGWLLLWLIGLCLVALRSLQPPAPRPITAPAESFSASRALRHVRALAHVPHPLGESEHARTCEYLIAQLQRMGLTPHVQTASVVGSRASRPFRAATVSNVWVQIPGRASTGTVLLAAHYDSVPTGPGAGDDAASVAAMLETLRALQARQGASLGLRNDVLLLFTDGEEAGLLGARAFVEALNATDLRPASASSVSSLPPTSSPTLQKPILALNFEARGAGGPSLMFETGPQNGGLVRQFVRAVPDPAASSLFYAVYKILPNDTDFTEFRGAGMRGLNFAFIDNVSHYHSALDNSGQLEGGSLQHQGDNMFGLLQTLGDSPLMADVGIDPQGRKGTKEPKNRQYQENRANNDAIYFNYARSAMVVYPEAWAIPLAVCATLLTAAFVAAGIRTGHFVPHRLLAGLLLVPLAAALAIGLSVLLTRILTALAPVPHSLLYLGNYTLAGVMLLSLALACVLFGRVQPRLSTNAMTKEQMQANRFCAPDGLVAGAAIWWLLLTWLTTLKLPGGSYLFLWPLMFVLAANLAGFALARKYARGRTEAESAPNAAQNALFGTLLVTAVPAVLLILPTLCLLFSALAMTALPVVGALTVLTIALLHPQIAALARLYPSRRYAPLLCAFVGLLLIGLDTAALHPTPARPQTNSLFYALDGDTGRALWASDDRKTDAWTAQFLGANPRRNTLLGFLPVSSGTFLQASAPAVSLPPPVVTLLSDSRNNDIRLVRLHLASPRHAPMLEIAALDADILEADIEGRPVSGNRDTGAPWSLLYFNVPAQGLTLTLHLHVGKQPSPLTLRVIDRSYDLPVFKDFKNFNGDFNDKSYTPRPTTMMPTPTAGWYQDTILVGKTFRFSRE